MDISFVFVSCRELHNLQTSDSIQTCFIFDFSLNCCFFLPTKRVTETNIHIESEPHARTTSRHFHNIKYSASSMLSWLLCYLQAGNL